MSKKCKFIIITELNKINSRCVKYWQLFEYIKLTKSFAEHSAVFSLTVPPYGGPLDYF